MSENSSNAPIELPLSLQHELDGFRRLARQRCLSRLVQIVVAAVCSATVLMFAIDRLVESSVFARGAIWLCVGAALVAASLSAIRVFQATWSPMSAARWIRKRGVAIGDEVLGALELASHGDTHASPELRQAALKQVGNRVAPEQLRPALPVSRTPRLNGWLLFGVASVVVVFWLDPRVTMNSARRWLMPWQETTRITMTRIEEVPASIVVPIGEASRFTVAVDESSSWSPTISELTFIDPLNPAITASRGGDSSNSQQFTFELPPMLEPARVRFSSGDFLSTVLITPKPRPKALRTRAQIQLPAYLSAQGVDDVTLPVTADGVSVLPDSRVQVLLETSKELSSANLNAAPMRVPRPRQAVSDAIRVDEQQEWNLVATDRDGLKFASPLSIDVKTLSDKAPSIAVRSESRSERILASESVAFAIRMSDDFAIRRFGIAWRQLDSDQETAETWRERQISMPLESFSVGRRKADFEARFQPAAYAIAGGKAGVRFWVEDDRTNANRVYSPMEELDVVSTTEHAVWMEEQLSKWRQIAVEVHDAELGLYETNRELARTSVASRDTRWQEKVAEQADAERQNARRLRQLTLDGRQLLTQAGRNPEIEAEQIKTIAESIVQLESLATEAMTRTAGLLDDAALASSSSNQTTGDEEPNEFEEIIDVESTLAAGQINAESGENAPENNETEPEPAGQPRLTLAGTTLVDKPNEKESETKDGKETSESSEGPDEIQLAVEDHAKVVEEFDRVAKQLSELMQGLEESTLVKRLKSASRQQDRISTRLDETIEATFGTDSEAALLAPTTDVMMEVALKVRDILDDLEAFCERRPIEPFISVRKDIQSSDILTSLRSMREGLSETPGIVFTESEFWAARLDQWADDLVPSGDDEQQESDSDSAPKRSLPPNAILEVLRLLEAEVELRERTREAERDRDSVTDQEHMTASVSLSETQDLLRDRLDVVIDDLESEPQGAFHFANEIEVLSAASQAMVDATKTLIARETGAAAIAAETEAIELLLQSRKVNPEPAANGASMTAQTEGTSEAAMQLIEESLNPLAKQRLRESNTSFQRDAEDVPKRYREPVREFFDRLEERRRLRDSKSRQ